MPSASKPDLTLYLSVLQQLEEHHIPYVVIGAFAALVYGINRSTHDIDIVVDMEEPHIQALAAAFPLPRYYADPYRMREAMRNGSNFNIIDVELGQKLGEDVSAQWQLLRESAREFAGRQGN